MTNSVGVDLDANIVATYDAAVNPATATTDTFVAQGMMSGARSGAFDFGGGNTSITFDPDDDYFTGEMVRVSATAGISDTGGAPATPYQWQFTAGPVIQRCAGGFREVDQSLTGLDEGVVTWGDYDNDGDLDILATGDNGYPGVKGYYTRVWRNDGGKFTVVSSSMPDVQSSSAAWGDYDNDGDLDILLAGDTGSSYLTQVWRNDGGTFSQISSSMPGIAGGFVAWGDYDNDGDLDILLAGDTGSGYVTQVWRNDGGTFSQISTTMPGTYHGFAVWGDYDNDGDIDILLGGNTESSRVTQLWRNDGGTFSQVTISLPGVATGAAAWGDYDNDNDLDILLAGGAAGGYVAQVWRNDGGTFTDISAGLTGVRRCSVAWGDYDNDGDLDILAAGGTDSGNVTQVWRNDGGTFSNIAAGVTPVEWCSVAWGDYDNDLDLDILLAGSISGFGTTELWRNDDCIDLALSKRANRPAVKPGGTIRYTVMYTNTGFEVVQGVVLTDVVPVQLRDVQYTHSGAVITPTGVLSYVWNIADLAPTAGGTVTVTVTVRDDAQLGSIFTNTAEIYSPLDVTATYRRSDVGTGVAFPAETVDPPMNATGVALDSGLQASFDVEIASGTVDTATFTAEGMMGGMLTGSYDVTAGTVTLDPDRSLFPGEIVRTTLSNGLQAVGGGPVSPFQWEFRAGPVISRCATLHPVETGLPGVKSKAVAWGDYDRDGYLDILLAMDDGAGDYGTKVYHNEHDGTFIDSGVVITGTVPETAAWADFDNDGYLDILVAAISMAQSMEFPNDAGRVWRNNRDGTFTNLGRDGWVTYGGWFGTANWMDYDNDGFQDVLTVGLTGWGSGTMSTMWVNDGGVDPDPYLDGNVIVPDVAYDAAAAWGDYDNDGNVDLLVAGFDTTEHGYPTSTLRISEVYRNADDHTFSPVGAGLPGTVNGAVAWGDYDDDGYVDFLLAGEMGSEYITRLYHNDTDGTFSDSGVDLPGTAYGGTAWGDYDNDGDLDFVVTGDGDTAGLIAEVYRNDGGGTFVAVDAELAGIRDGAVAWGDYDNDGDLDLILAGDSGEGGLVTQLYRNDDCADLHIAKDVEPAANVPWHSVVTYTVALSNGGGIAYDVALSDTLPAQVEFGDWIGNAHGAVRTGEAITWTGTLSTGDCLTWIWTMTHTGGYGDVVRNTAWYSHTSGGRTRQCDVRDHQHARSGTGGRAEGLCVRARSRRDSTDRGRGRSASHRAECGQYHGGRRFLGRRVLRSARTAAADQRALADDRGERHRVGCDEGPGTR